MKERDLLIALYNFIVSKQIVVGDKDSIYDMVRRYKHPPLSMAFPVVLRMTMQQSNQLNEILKRIQILVAFDEVTPLSTPIVKTDEKDDN